MRKWIMVLLGVFGAIGAVLSSEFGLTVQLGSVVAGLGAILIYVFGEAKADMARISTQTGKFKDPKFLITLLSAVVAALAQEISLPLDPAIIIAVLSAIVAALFKKEQPA